MPRNIARTLYIRESLKNALNGIWDYSLTVVEAPMGYGKTTAVKEFLRSCKAEVLWQTLHDDSAAGFWNGFSRLFRKLSPVVAERLAGMGVPGNSVLWEEAVRMVGEIDFAAKTAIVFDDYHLLSSENIDRFIELLVRAEIPNLHVIIVSRSVFGENTTELALKGYCAVVDKSCFEFSRDDIVEYCRACGVSLNDEDTGFLVSYTEGWISAVYLCILGFLQEGRIEHQASLNELIEKVAYQNSSAETKDFLLSICIFDSFSLEQAEYMWKRGNAEDLLRRLVAQNAFIKHDQINGMFYMHNIFTAYLRRIFGRLSLDRRRAAWKTAGEWHLNAGDYMHAMDSFYKTADFAGILTTIELDGGKSITNEHKEKLIRYFGECPAKIREEHPWACLIYAINLFSFNEMELFAQQCEEIGGYVTSSPWLEEADRAKLAGELEILVSFAKYNSIMGMFEHHQRAEALLDGPAEFIDRQGSWTFGAPSVLYMFYRESGCLEQEVREMFEAMPCYLRLTAGHGSGAEYVMQAERFYNIGDFDSAQIAAHKALYVAQSQEQVALELCALFLQMRLAMVKGDFAFVTDTLKQTRDRIKEQGLYLYIHTWDMCEGYIYACLDQAKKIPLWVVTGDLAESPIFFPSVAFLNIIRAKALLIDGQYLKLIGLAGEFAAVASVFPNLLGQVYIYIYEAAAKFKLGRYEDGLATLRQAVAIAAPDRVQMPFVENGEYIADGLVALESDGYWPEFIGMIREAFPPIAGNCAAMKAKLGSGCKAGRLTKREREIAELVAAGMSNRAIGEALFLAEITVKKALQSIFAKTDVKSRTALTKLMVEQETG